MWRALLILLLPILARGQFNDLNDPGFVAGLKSPSTLWNGISTNPPGIWLDVTQYVGSADFTILTTVTNYGSYGGFFADIDSPATNKLFRTISGGAFTGRSLGNNGSVWHSRVGETNTQQYFQQNFGTIAMRINFANVASDRGFFQSGANAPTPNYAFCQLFSSGLYFDWGAGAANRINATAPSANGSWLNLVYVKDNGTMTLYVEGTNFVSASSKTGGITNVYSGPLTVLQNLTATNYLLKRVFCFDHAFTSVQASNMSVLMSGMP